MRVTLVRTMTVLCFIGWDRKSVYMITKELAQQLHNIASTNGTEQDPLQLLNQRLII